ncbi:MAG TPA: PH domain-containing protein [Thermoplasmata archaeon]|nr:PH domain-containing protein [Thermoplasmata archaeon]
MAAASNRAVPKLLKATYLANQEYLLAETRATKLFYFPGPILWILITGVLTILTAADRFGWGLQLSVWNTAISTLATWTHQSLSSFQLYAMIFFAFLVLIGLLFIAVRYLRWVRTVYAVTSRRVIVQRGILAKDFDEIPVTQVRGVDVHQTFGERVLGYGSVRVSSEGGQRLGNEDWKGIPKPFRFQKLIENATVGASAPTPTAPGPWTGGAGR